MLKKTIYILIVAALSVSLLAAFVTKQFGVDLGAMDWIAHWVSSPIALLLGIVFALTFGATFEKFTKLMSKKMLQYSVVGLGFGMNVNQALASGKEGMLFTIISVFGTLAIGWHTFGCQAYANARFLYYINEIRNAVLIVHGEKAHSRYFGENAYKYMTEGKADSYPFSSPNGGGREGASFPKNKELLIIPGASHCDLYDGGKDKVIPWEKLESFFNDNLK